MSCSPLPISRFVAIGRSPSSPNSIATMATVEGEEEIGESASSSSKNSGGYSADCSASDQSSDDAPKPRWKKRHSEQEGSEQQQPMEHSLANRDSEGGGNLDETSPQVDNATFTSSGAFFPQWNGVVITNPMDPRLDLTNVNMQASALYQYMLPQQHPQPQQKLGTGQQLQQSHGSEEKQPPPPSFSVEQYARLLEVS